jgi:hypothetical protein
MAVEIRELVIKTVVDNSKGREKRANKRAERSGSSDIVSECVAQVMDLLNQRKER